MSQDRRTDPYSSPEAPAVPPPDARAVEKASIFNHPIGFWFFFWGEFAERSCYYGMRAILLLYMVERLGFSDGKASGVISYFIAACYLLPLAGGFVADNYLGKYRTIVGFSVPYVLGQLLLGFENLQSVDLLLLALALLAGGSGVIKPNISTLMGLTYDQKRPGQTKLRSDAFAMFYFSINVGAALSSFAVPTLRDLATEWSGSRAHGYAVAFRFPAVLMVLALATFALGKRFYAVEEIRKVRLTPEQKHERRAARRHTLGLLLAALGRLASADWPSAQERFRQCFFSIPEDVRDRLAVLGRIFGLFFVVMFFWSIFDQSTNTWTLFARDHLVLDLFGWKVAPDAIQGLNPVLIILLLPPITILWHLLARLGLELRPTDKMLIGFVLTAFTMGIMAVAGYLAGPEGRISILWEVVPYILITIAEICISVVGLELAFAAAPPTMKSFITACWLLTVFFGDMLNAQVTPWYDQAVFGFDLTPGRYFLLFALLMIPVTLAFALVARRFNRNLAQGSG